MSGTWRFWPKDEPAEAGGRALAMGGISWESAMPVGDSTSAVSSAGSGGEGAEGARGGGAGTGGLSREGSMMLSLLRRDLFEDE